MALAFKNGRILLYSSMLILFACILDQKWDITQLDFLLFHPERAHYSSADLITSKSNKIFEGWYYKIASTDIQFGVIPGVYHSTNKDGDYAFIFLASPHFVYEYRYPLNEYHTDKGSNQDFFISIGPNNFSRNAVSLFLESTYIQSIQPTNYPKYREAVKMNLTFYNQLDGFPVSLFNLGAMGYYGYIPWFECYHGILSMNYWIDGTIQLWNDIVYDKDSTRAKGYLEKDWGTNFPKTWVWIQANHFVKNENVSLTLALSSVPLFGDSIITKAGFLGGLYFNGRIYKLGTYTWAKVRRFEIRDEHDVRRISLEIDSFWGTQRLNVVATVPNAYQLQRKDAMKIFPHLMAPQSDGYMKPVLIEWLDAKVWIRFEDDDNDIVFEGESYPATVECHGEDDMKYILENFGE